jgi:hypothetical protein
MRKPLVLIPLAIIHLAALPAAAQEAPRVLFCMGQCFGVDKNGARIPVTKGTELAPGLRLETGPGSYAQVKLGPDNACGIGENARVRFDRSVKDRDVVILDQGRIRVIGGELLGHPVARPVELRTTEGPILLRSADIEVKAVSRSADTPPAPTLVKLNVGDARIGELPVSRDAVQGIVGGKILERTIPIGDIALPRPPREPASPGPGGTAVRPPLLTLPVINLPVAEVKPIAAPVALAPAIMAPTLAGTTTGTNLSPTNSLTVTLSPIAPIATAPVVPSTDLLFAQPITTSLGPKTLTEIAKQVQTSTTSTLLNDNLTIQAPTSTKGDAGLSPRTFTFPR